MTQTVTQAPLTAPRTVAAARPPVASARSGAADLPWWVIIALLVFCAVYFHSKLDPGTRFSIRMGHVNYGPSWFQNQSLGPFAPADLAILGFAYLALINRFAKGWFTVSRRAVGATVLAASVVALGTVVGILHGTHNPFGDWRDLVMGVLFAFALWSTVLRSEEGCFRFAQLFVVIVGAYGAVQLIQFMGGGGEIAFYGRTPTGDHATLEYMVAMVGVSLAMLRTRRSRSLWVFGALVGTAVVALGFRRYAWVELGVVYGVFLLLTDRTSRRQYLKGLFVVLVAVAVAVAMTWSQLHWSERFASLDPWQTKVENKYATTNQGHLDEIRDGLDQVQKNPVVGLGVGITYVGQRTARWKGDAGMVHNGLVEMWIKFGILGLVTYVGLYMALFWSIWKRRRGTRYSDLLAWGAGAFLFGNFLINATVYPWPFGVWEKSILIFAMIAVAFPVRPESDNAVSIKDAVR